MLRPFSRFSILCICAAMAAGCATAGGHPDDTSAIFNQGVTAYDAKNYAEAFRLFESIDDTDLAAMRNEALMLRRGEGVEKDPKAAEEMYARAAKGGLATAAADLGDMLLKGEADAPDPKAALPWLKAAAEAHHPIAAYQVGQMYETGTGVTRDMETAKKYYRQAADLGMPEAIKRLSDLNIVYRPLDAKTP